jgi:hypothetical protein
MWDEGGGENVDPDKRTLIFADGVLIWGKDKKRSRRETESVEHYHKGI